MKLCMRSGLLLLLPAITACAPGTVPAPAPATAAAPGQPSPAAALALEGGGLRVFTGPSASARPLPFGTARADTLAILETVRGTPPMLGDDPECGATHAYWPDGLWVWFFDDAFAGWMVDSAEVAVSTVSGLKVGTTRDALAEGGTVVTVAPSSLGAEFTAGGMAGLFESEAADARITHLWAGQVCIMR